MNPLSRPLRGPRFGWSVRPLQLLLGIVAMSLASAAALRAQDGTRAASVELFTGVAWNVPSPLVVRLDGERRVMHARYSTRPFEGAPYYSYRLGHTSVGREIDVDMLSHKQYLDNPVPPVTRLEVRHGYNMPTVNLAQRSAGWRWRAGLGIVVAHRAGVVGGVGARNVVAARRATLPRHDA